LLTANGREVVRLVNDEDGRAQDWPFAYGGAFHRYGIEWTSSGITALVEDCPRLSDPRVDGVQRTFGISMAGASDVTVRVNTLFVSSFGPGGVVENIPADCGPASGPAAPQPAAPATKHHRERIWWWVGASAVVVVAVTLIAVAVRRRSPRKLRPGHRK